MTQDSARDKSAAAAAAPVPAGVTFNFGQKVDSSALGSLGSKSTPSFSFSSSSKTSWFGTPGSAAEDAKPGGKKLFTHLGFAVKVIIDNEEIKLSSDVLKMVRCERVILNDKAISGNVHFYFK